MAKNTLNTDGLQELRAARASGRALFGAVIVFSVFVNLLMLAGPIYMLQIYDRVLSSRSEATLIALTGLITFLFLAMGFLDYARGRIVARIGASFQDRLDRRVFHASMRRAEADPNDKLVLSAQRDLEAIQRLLSSPTLLALMDVPWTPIFVMAIFLLHPWLGWLAVAGMTLLIALALLQQRVSAEAMGRANGDVVRAERIADLLKQESEAVRALGMRGAGLTRWEAARRAALDGTISVSDRTGGFTAFSKTFRLFLQSAILGLGAWLVLMDQLTAGAMIAGSILLGRAMAPVDQSIGQWGTVERARAGWRNLADLLSAVPAEPRRTELPRPEPRLDVEGITVLPPGHKKAALRMVSFSLMPGQALGVIGPSGAGKSTLARAVIGAWAPAAGTVRLAGASLDQYDPDILGRWIGYLPQRVTLFDGTVAQNIARLLGEPESAKVVAAAQKAGVHDMILGLPQGYDTPLTQHGGQLSGGQVQRIGLARAMYDDPLLLVLDEPNSSLDNDGSLALNGAIHAAKAAGHLVIIIAHRPAAIQECDLLLVLEDGMRKAFGPREQVLREMVANHQQLQPHLAPKAVT